MKLAIPVRSLTLFILLLFLFAGFNAVSAAYEPSSVQPPKLNREFRGLWVATVGNIDWPSKRDLPSSAQKAELIALLDRAAELNLNAIILQVRPACDAFYRSDLEPWSEYLTGTMGKAPTPYYDPLAFAIAEAHKRGLELHAWFNPYRAMHKTHEGSSARNHISKTRPDLIRRFGQYLWLDPGDPDVQEHSLRVVMDVVKRYDIDAVHFDDYFYPDPAEASVPFPDRNTWKRFGANGKLSFEDWRRENVNRFIERVYRSIKSTKPWVKFGISPHGIWRPGFPPQIRGSDSFAKLSADSRKWLQNGWLDYFSPQLYWTNDSREQSFPVLLKWWSEQNSSGRHLWPGLSAAYALSNNWRPDEIPNQIENMRKNAGANGYILFSASKLFANPALAGRLKREVQREKALVPASPWLNSSTPARPVAKVGGFGSHLKISFAPGGTNHVISWWAIQQKVSNNWQLAIIPAEERTFGLRGAPEVVAVIAIDRFGNASAPTVFQLKKPASKPAPKPSPRKRY
jgi:uncharacterized lipoprotein YddW (UPF0748 family)